MLDPDKPIAEHQRDRLIRNLKSYRETPRGRNGKAMTWEELSEHVGVSASTLTEVVNGKYNADATAVLRKIDQFLADETMRAGRIIDKRFTHISLTEKIKGAINQGIKHNSMPVIIGEPGSSKTEHARWFVAQHPGAVLIEPDDADNDARWVVDQLCQAFKIATIYKFMRDRKRTLVDYLQRHKNRVIVCDESQKLTASAIEMFRRLHDLSDPTGQRNVVVVFFGDEDFYKLIVRSRGGTRTPISPQITRRMYPIFDIKVHGCQFTRGGDPIPGTQYTAEDIKQICAQRKLRIVRPDVIDWIKRLANVHGHGSLGQAIVVASVASSDLARNHDVTINELVMALQLVFGPDDAMLLSDKCDEPLLPQAAIA